MTGTWTRRQLLSAALLAGAPAIALSGCARKAIWVGPGGSLASAGPTSSGVAAPSPSVNSAPQPATPADSLKPRYLPGTCLVGSYLDIKGQSEAQALALRHQQLGRNLSIWHTYWEWDSPMPRQAPAPADAIPLLSWRGTYHAPILNGSQDGLIARAADALAAIKKPIFLRWAWEMNGDWYYWDGPHNGNNPAGYVRAWRHIHDIFVQRKALNVSWVWGPNVESKPMDPWNEMENYYPGDDYVDWIAASGYSNGRNGPDMLFQKFTDRYKSRKPIMLAETGIEEHGGTVKADWIKSLHSWLVANPAVGALVWFDTDDDQGTGQNWRIDSSPSALAAFGDMVADPHFG
jgi:hypothetical protein